MILTASPSTKCCCPSTPLEGANSFLLKLHCSIHQPTREINSNHLVVVTVTLFDLIYYTDSVRHTLKLIATYCFAYIFEDVAQSKTSITTTTAEDKYSISWYRVFLDQSRAE